jgi:hypothetical protein
MEEEFESFSPIVKEMHLNEQGLADDPKELRELVHDFTCVVGLLIDLPELRWMLPGGLLDGLETMVDSAHDMVCDKMAEAEARKANDALDFGAIADRILEQVFGKQEEKKEWPLKSEQEDNNND